MEITKQAQNRKDLVDIKDVSKIYSIPNQDLFGKPTQLHALDGINLQVKVSETLGVIGESGCGKTTLGKCVIRLVKATKGEIYFKDRNVLTMNDKELRNVRQDMSMVFQDPYSSLDPRKTVGKQISIPLEIHNIGNKQERQARVEELLENVGLSTYHAVRYPHEFSGGQRQRINIARALAVNPEFVICDEPVSALDVSVQSQVLNLLNDLKSKFNLTYMFISHDLSVVKYISNRIAVMYLGRIVETGLSEDIYKEAAHPYTKALLSSIPPDSPYHKKAASTSVIKGEVSQVTAHRNCCLFYDRCPYARDICKEQQPQLQNLSEHHQVACFNYSNL